MLGKFLYGAFVGGVMAAAGLSIASLVAPERTRLADLADADADRVPSETLDAPDDEIVAPPATAPEVPAEKSPVTAEPPVAPQPVQPEPATTEPAVEPAVTVELTPPAPATPSEPAASADAPAAQSDAVAKLTNDVLAVLEPSDPAVAPAEPAPKPSDPLAATVSDPPPTPLVPAEPAAVMPDVSVLPAPKVPTGPAMPPLPDQDAVLAGVEAPAPPPAPPEEALLADAGEAREPVLPDVFDPAPVPTERPPAAEPAPAADETMPAPGPDPDTPPGSDVPGSEAARIPGNQPGGLPGAAPEAEPSPGDADAARLPTTEDTPGPTFKPAPGFGDKTDGVVIGRLPRIGDQPAEDPVVEAAEEEPEEDYLPLKRYARPFENLDGKPLFAVVLIDTGEADLDRAALANLPFPATFAVDPLAPDAAQHAAIYRAAGQEVVMLATGIADGATASDIEVGFQSMAQGLPEAVAVMDDPKHTFQGNRPLASLVVPVIAAQGRGLLTWDQGLNAADQVARRIDLAATVVFRNLDDAGEDRAAIRRYLDRAAFKAGQEGRVTVVGQTRPETVAALLEWTVEGRAANVALAPVSAVLTVE